MGKKDDTGLWSLLKRSFHRHKILCSIGILVLLFITMITTSIVSNPSLLPLLLLPPPATGGESIITNSIDVVSTPSPSTSTSSSKCHWTPEPLQGKCDSIRPTTQSQQYATAVECEVGCCETEPCIAYQYRSKEGCIWGLADMRLGNEKDGPSAWCEPRAPAMWVGQWIKSNDDVGVSVVPNACEDSGWNPNELNGQCFGLGSRRTSEDVASHTAEACRDACCADSNCKIWQWRIDAGCFYAASGFSCMESNPQDFEPFIGKRKVQPNRSYQPYAYSGDFADMATTVVGPS
jgi:hypothetical protein